MTFADFSRWPQTALLEFIEDINEIAEEEHEMNRVVLSYNPILCICLACIHLTEIGNSISLFKHMGQNVSENLIALGKEIIDTMNNENIKTIFMD